MEELLQTCGYIAAYLGTFLEGEILLLTTIITAKMGYMNLYIALIAAFGGAYTRDWLTFLLARKKGKSFIDNKPKLKTKFKTVNKWMEKNPTLLLITYRLLFGFVTVVVVMTGISNISMKRFGLFSAISNALWVSIYGILGFFCADAMLKNIDLINQNKGFVIGILITLGLSYWLFVKRKEIKPIES